MKHWISLVSLLVTTPSLAAPISFTAGCGNNNALHVKGTYSGPRAADFFAVPAKKGLLLLRDSGKTGGCDIFGGGCGNIYDEYDTKGCYGLSSKVPLTVTLNGKVYRSEVPWSFSGDGTEHWNDPTVFSQGPWALLVCPTEVTGLRKVGSGAMYFTDNGMFHDQIPYGIGVDDHSVVTRADYSRLGLKAFLDEELSEASVGLVAADGSKLYVNELGVNKDGAVAPVIFTIEQAPNDFFHTGSEVCLVGG